MKQELLNTGRVLIGAAVAVAALDLSMVAGRLSAQGWEEERIDAAINGYKTFLQDVGNGSNFRPEPDVDAVWHEHILHTQQYAKDCESIFGAFLHHTPEPASAELCVASIGTEALCVPSVERLCVASVDTQQPVN